MIMINKADRMACQASGAAKVAQNLHIVQKMPFYSLIHKAHSPFGEAHSHNISRVVPAMGCIFTVQNA